MPIFRFPWSCFLLRGVTTSTLVLGVSAGCSLLAAAVQLGPSVIHAPGVSGFSCYLQMWELASHKTAGEAQHHLEMWGSSLPKGQSHLWELGNGWITALAFCLCAVLRPGSFVQQVQKSSIRQVNAAAKRLADCWWPCEAVTSSATHCFASSLASLLLPLFKNMIKFVTLTRFTCTVQQC